MKQALTIKTGQYLAMTPALRQGIELLNLPSQEIEAKIQETLDSNIMLEEDIPSNDSTDIEASTQEEEEKSEIENEMLDKLDGDLDDVEVAANLEAERGASITDDIVDESDSAMLYEDWLPGGIERQYTQFESTGNSSDRLPPRADENEAEPPSLRKHLIDQLELVNVSAEEQAIGLVIIDSLNEDGFLSIPLEEILSSLAMDDSDTSAGEQNIPSVSDIESILKEVIQNFEPTGVGARTLQESLLLQLLALEDSTPYREDAIRCCSEFLDLFRTKDLTQLKNQLDLDERTFLSVVDLIRSLNPRPGASYVDHEAQYIVPDVYVSKVNDLWRVESNSSLCPPLRINSYYASLMSGVTQDADNKTMQKHLTGAKFFLKSLKQRSETVLDVAKAIVARQTNFLEKGEEAMKPMVLQDIADVVGRNASTISRATSGKYMDTPRGIFELKYFFDSHVQTEDGGTASSVAIRNHIRKLVADEKGISPHSDQKISELLSDLGFKVARRTVAKYRIALSIPSSSERKQFIS